MFVLLFLRSWFYCFFSQAAGECLERNLTTVPAAIRTSLQSLDAVQSFRLAYARVEKALAKVAHTAFPYTRVNVCDALVSIASTTTTRRVMQEASFRREGEVRFLLSLLWVLLTCVFLCFFKYQWT